MRTSLMLLCALAASWGCAGLRPEQQGSQVPLDTSHAEASEIIVASTLPVSTAYARDDVRYGDDAAGTPFWGRVLVNGEIPTEPVTLFLHNARQGGISSLNTNTKSGRDGSFRFAGVPPDWSGTLRVADGHFFDTDGEVTRYLQLEQPVADLTLQLGRWYLSGTLLNLDGTPAANAEVDRVTTHALDWGGRSWGTDITADASGNFRIPIQDAEFDSVSIVAVDAARSRSTREIFHLHQLVEEDSRELDVGEIWLESATIPFVVLDDHGEPIPHATVTVPDVETWVNAGPDGRGVLAVWNELERVVAGVEGYWTTEFKIPSASATPWRLVLAPSNKLEIVLTGDAGRSPRGAKIRMEAKGPILASLDASGEWVDSRESPYPPFIGTGTSSLSGAHAELEVDETGRLVVRGIWPGKSIDITVLDEDELEIAQDRVVLGVQEVKQLSYSVDSAPPIVGNLVGLVTGPDENPVTGAVVWVRGASSGHYTDRRGRFWFEGLRDSEVAVRIIKEGFAPLLLEDVPITHKRRPLHFVMPRAHEVTVRVVDEGGEAVSGERVRASLEWLDKTLDIENAKEVAPGNYEFLYLPPRAVELSAFVGDREYTIQHDPGYADAEIVIPTQGHLEVNWNLAHTQPSAFYQLVLERRDVPNDRLEFELPENPEHESALIIPHVLPASYDAFLEVYDTSADPADLEWQRISARVEVNVRAGDTTRVQLSD